MELTIGQKIRRARELSGLKQEALAEKLGISQASYSKIESDDTDVTISRLERIAKILKLDIQDIIGLDKNVFFNKNTNVTYLTNSNFNDLTMIQELLASKNRIIESLEAQIALMAKK